jgi:hypothetical protein
MRTEKEERRMQKIEGSVLMGRAKGEPRQVETMMMKTIEYRRRHYKWRAGALQGKALRKWAIWAISCSDLKKTDENFFLHWLVNHPSISY